MDLIKMCFLAIWANFTIGMMSGGCVSVHIGNIFCGYDIRLCFLAI
jgi:hypothetical protein